jgi:D-inositol-3-phosphate glycosyltransferase
MLSVHTCPLAMLGGKETGGMNVYVRDLSRELALRGHRVDVFTRSQSPDITRVSLALGAGARVIHLPTGPEAPYDKHKVYGYLPQFVAGALAQAQADGIRYDIIHSHYWLSGAAARDLRDHWRAPIVHMAHTLGMMKNLVAQRPEERETDERIAVERDITRFADALVAATPAEQQQLVTLYGADPQCIRVISPGVDTDRFHPIPPAQARSQIGTCPLRRMILFVGRIEPLKGVESLLRAIALVVARQPELRDALCVPIIGGDPDRVKENSELARLHQLRAGLGLDEAVLFVGAKNQDSLHNYYSAAEMVVMPSDYESFGMVALEAMACGTPVIASDVGGLAYLIRDGRTGYRVPARDPKALADKIARLLNDEGLRRRIGQRAACWAESYSWPRIADRILALYETVLQSQG